jgi:hypothetical protein
MKTLITSLLLSACVLAENSNYSFEDAAKKYDAKAKAALEAGNDQDAAIYQKLAAIKRDAAKTNGNYDWSEYHALTAKLGTGNKKHYTHKKKYSADDGAAKYDKLAKKAADAENYEEAAIYKRMAEIKREAAASKGKYDWKESHQLEGTLKKLKYPEHKKY